MSRRGEQTIVRNQERDEVREQRLEQQVDADVAVEHDAELVDQ